MQSTQNLGWLLMLPLVLPWIVPLCFSESVFDLNPLIDTRLPQGFTEGNFNKIQPEMTKAEVSRLIQAQPDGISQTCMFTQLEQVEGKENNKLPKTLNALMTKRPHSCWEYGKDGAAFFGDYAWFSFRILFDKNDRVITTERQVNYD
jgi:hypothetical protein